MAAVTKPPLMKNIEFLDTTTSRSSDTSDGSSSDTSSVVERKKNPLNVKFNSIQIRYYDITLGDNPSCMYGPPVTLDWNYDEMEPVAIDSYEEGKKNPPRRMHQMVMLSRQRKNLLKTAAGITDDEIFAATDEMHKIQKERNMTNIPLPCSGIQDATMSSRRKGQHSRRAWKERLLP